MAKKKPATVADQLAPVERVEGQFPANPAEYYLYQIMVAALGIREDLAVIKARLEQGTVNPPVALVEAGKDTSNSKVGE